MVVTHHINGYEAFQEFIYNYDFQNKVVYVYFSGEKDPAGVSWCDDCNIAWPIVQKELTKLPKDAHFVIVEVGDQPTWKNPQCPFRKDPKTRLLVVPTLIRWGGPQRLEGEQLWKAELIEMMFTHEEED
ncbi:thioredoxin domain-containing protein 17-like [Anthonomus grandis grandis]|uniref:thioredoxin domain-containing protein 17-like n=1 Tax=Anthonomus grandis grandis TaxID=2921223 RepID=UPI002165104B|nr:thioredoxin domain-containing protein 17-like [Anthonomus grandis grandis]XP_050304380.1 thioredoxin domain-containing protein 17-like [Anthonomus grandis grandis]XP_050304381.1 thioredoxin domain-containing protein 17-like [Anthonomus grandis grandis]